MTHEEAKQLKPGDKVLVEMIIGLDPHDHRAIDSDGDVWFKYRYVKPEHIREKITPPRRKFKKGDIVLLKRNGRFCVVAEDESDDYYDIKLLLGTQATEEIAGRLELICPVEDRHDRKEDA